MKKFILTIGVFVMFGMINTVVAQQPANEPASNIQKKHKANCKKMCCAKANTKQTSTGVVKTKCKSSCSSKKCCSKSASKSVSSGTTKAKCATSCKSKCCASASKNSSSKEN